MYDYFLRHDTFEGCGLPRVEVPRNRVDLLIELFWIGLIGVPSLISLFWFLWTSSLLSQMIFFLVVALGECRSVSSPPFDVDRFV